MENQPQNILSENNWYDFMFVHSARALNSPGLRILHVLWNVAALLASSAALCGVCLNFAIGRYHLFYIYLGYFKNPEIFILNWVPLLLVQILFYAVFNRQWLAFLGTAVLALAMSLGNYFKIIFRSDPFTFDDMSSIGAGLQIAGDYDVSIDGRILLALIFIAVAVLILFFFARGRIGTISRLIWAAVVFASIIPLWRTIYSDGRRYYENSYTNYLFVTRDKRDNFVANGFFYPFLYSITESSNIQPENYDEAASAALYAEYKNVDIPEAEKLNIMILQLESFSDLEAMGLREIADQVYEPLRELQDSNYSGTLIANVIGGGTINTERAVLTGCCNQQDYYKPSYSYVRYLNVQGFHTIVTHPNDPNYYARKAVNQNLGFQDFYNLENWFKEITNGQWRCDESYLPEVFRIFRKSAESGQEPVFMFNVSLQGHSPYNNEAYDREENLWTGNGVSEQTRYVLNNYLSQISETQRVLKTELINLQDCTTPMVVLFYGDHKPWFGDEVYKELGLEPSMESEQKMNDYRGTPYVIWANDAAKTLTGSGFSGCGPMVSPGYLMNVLFDQLSWDGSAFMQYTRSVMQHIPVICTRGGFVEDGQYRRSLSSAGKDSLSAYQNLTYYLHFKPELAEVRNG